jgi:hypothetical protein
MDAASVDYIVPTHSQVFLRVTTIDGRQMLSRDLGHHDMGAYTTTLNVQEWSPGLYLCHVTIGTRTVVSRIVVQN